MWQGAGLGRARRPPQPPSETTSLAFFARIDVQPSLPPPSTDVDDTAIGSPPSPHPPSDEDQTTGSRARCDTLHSSSPRSSSSAFSSPLAGRRRRGRRPRQQTRPSCRYRHMRGGHVTSGAGLARRGRHLTRRNCCSISPRTPPRPQFDCRVHQYLSTSSALS